MNAGVQHCDGIRMALSLSAYTLLLRAHPFLCELCFHLYLVQPHSLVFADRSLYLDDGHVVGICVCHCA